jgi:hypothetical protein
MGYACLSRFGDPWCMELFLSFQFLLSSFNMPYVFQTINNRCFQGVNVIKITLPNLCISNISGSKNPAPLGLET